MCIEGGELARCIIREGGEFTLLFYRRGPPCESSGLMNRTINKLESSTRGLPWKFIYLHATTESRCVNSILDFYYFFNLFIYLFFFTARSNAQHFSPSQEFPCAHYCLSQVLLYVSPPIAISNNITSCCYGKNLRHRGFN